MRALPKCPNLGTELRLRREWANQDWNSDFVRGKSRNGRAIHLLDLIPDYINFPATRAGRWLRSFEVTEAPTDMTPFRRSLERILSHDRSLLMDQNLRAEYTWDK